MDTLTSQWVRRWMALAAAEFEARRAELNELDAAISDGDHGTNVARGYAGAASAVANARSRLPSELFETVGLTFLSAINGSSGPMLGSTFLRMSEAAAKVEDSEGWLDAPALAVLIEAGARGVMRRGHAHVGSKTMADAWIPAANAARDAAASGGDCLAVLRAAARGAAEGTRETANLRAFKGRAQYRAERSVGHIDAGAQSSTYLFELAVRAAEEVSDDVSRP